MAGGHLLWRAFSYAYGFLGLGLTFANALFTGALFRARSAEEAAALRKGKS